MGKQINNLKPEECIVIYQVIANNANDLLKTARSAAAIKKYGIATSLTILGAEEYSKAIIVLLHAHGVKIFKIDEAIKVFRDHKAKHGVAYAFELLNLLNPIINIIETISLINFKKPGSLISHIPGLLMHFSESGLESKKVFSNIEWWEKADQIKQNGFYVNFNDRLFTPDELTNADFKKAISTTERLRHSYRLLNVFISRYPDLKEAFQKTINKGIDVYLSNAGKLKDNKNLTQRNGMSKDKKLI
jgi:AbiV family abortive infection protein